MIAGNKNDLDVLKSLLEVTSPFIGEEFLTTFVCALGTLFEADTTFVTRVLDDPPTRVRALAAWKDGAYKESWEYDLDGNPCQMTYNGEPTYIPCDVWKKFERKKDSGYESYVGIPLRNSIGRITGHLAIYSKTPLEDRQRVLEIARVFADRAETEAERLIVEAERKEAVEALLESEERHRHFAADVAHELRTPLAVLRLHLDNLGDDKTIQSLSRDVDAMARLVSQLLAKARLESLVVNNADTADLLSICTGVAEFLAPIAVEEQRSIEVIGSQHPVVIRGNAAALEMAVRNLVENALRYSAPNTVVTIDVSDDPAISVINHGRSIPPELREVIFRRFKRNDQRAGGAGLGLSIVKRAVEAQEGVIEITDPPGGGAIFTIRFPAVKIVKTAVN